MKNKQLFDRSELTSTLWAFRREFIMVGIFSLISNVLMLAPTLYMLQIYDRVLASQSELTLLAMSVLTLGFFSAIAFAEWMRSRVLVSAGLRLDQQLSNRVFNASFESNLEASRNSPSNAFVDLIQVRQFLTGNGILALFDMPWAPIYLAVTFLLHPILGYLATAFVVVQACLGWYGHKFTVLPTEIANKAANEANLYLHGKVRNAEVIESMGMLSGIQKRWTDRHINWLAKSSAASAITHRMVAWSKTIRYAQQSLSLAAGALLVIDGQLSIGGMFAANILISRALAPVDMVVGTWPSLVTAVAAFRRLEGLLINFPERDPALTRVAPTGELTLRAVYAIAPGRAEPILKNINFSVMPGTTTVVLGPSGSGKSTLARTILGIWPNVTGEILVNGLPIQSWNRTELGPHIGYLPQDVELFDGSIAENIARFSEINTNMIIEAARSAGLHEMILRFPKGYDTPIGEAGGLLSGGQRQRIGLARAIYRNPALIVLDEPNANLDDAGELALMQTVQLLKTRGKTIFLITHRPESIAVADRLMIMVNGHIQVEGPRDAVLAAIQRSQQAAQQSGAQAQIRSGQIGNSTAGESA
jgi:ATP-binding cassette subfamily C exporter for protease/lipase